MRLYTFSNMYLSPLQVGLQSAHVTSELFYKYSKKTACANKKDMLFRWATLDKTMILLNGGYSSNLYNLSNLFNIMDNFYPWAVFHESGDALEGVCTCVGIVLPPRIYKTANLCRKINLNPYMFLDYSYCNHNFRSNLSYLVNKIHRKFIGIDKKHSLECSMVDKKFQSSITKWECDLILELNKYNLAR